MMDTINWMLLSLCLSLSSISSDDYAVSGSGKFDNDLLYNILSHPSGDVRTCDYFVILTSLITNGSLVTLGLQMTKSTSKLSLLTYRGKVNNSTE